MDINLTKRIRMKMFLFMTFIVIACNSNTRNELLDNSQLNDKLNSLFLETNIKVKSEILEQSKTEIKIFIVFEEPYIIRSEYQEVIMSYILHKYNVLQTFDKVAFVYSIDIEKKTNPKYVSYTKDRIIEINDKYKSNGKFIEILEYCFKNLLTNDPIELDIALKVVNKKYEDDTYKASFFPLLALFNEDCIDYTTSDGIESLAVNTYVSLIQLYATGGKDYARLTEVLYGIWHICTGQKIKYNAESNMLEEI